MESKSLCPYCGKEMHLGYIPQDRYGIKWIPEEKYEGPIFQWFAKGIKLTGLGLSSEIESFYCEDCQKIIIDTKDKKNKLGKDFTS